ncbi:hypothetical protein SAMN03159338_3437 [Sphingomonas sp. NFR04]|uniref:transferrin-binding protein-like solute binding protein n=1 Tax=Sphingomonas sp. NFR04 TaxID=1566283 RepID=UPI0008E9569F|nr:transferrin-binding protein-like solute binding protein [Sphingomonas sp. NFR04]SFK15763.1 hypothetical protein SAMN03159338_3437 [Sphingomonas sp. NFR04]
MKFHLLAVVPPSLILAACSGGGGGTGPATSAPVAPAAPVPAPTPTPTPTNTSLAGPLVSESFAANAARAAATFTDAGGSAGTASGGDLQIRYDATDGSYTLTSGARSQTFGKSGTKQPGSISSVYTVTTGSTVDALSLTRKAASGSAYEYVAGGVWQTATTNGSSVDGSVNVFTYGVTTPNTALPRTGSAGYALDALGVFSSKQELEPNTLSGTGTLTADFVTGKITTGGDFALTRPSKGPSGYTGRWSGTGAIAASTNSISGAMTVFAYAQMDGGFNGRFYGPAANEIGLSFWGTSSTGEAVAGALIGRQSAGVTSAQKLADLSKDTSFGMGTSALSIYETDASGLTRGSFGALRASSVVGSSSSVKYVASSGGYAIETQRLDLDDMSVVKYDQPAVTTADKLAVQSDPNFTAYRTKAPSGEPVDVKIYRPGGGNAELALSYLSFVWTETLSVPTSAGRSTQRTAYVPFGYETAASQIPVTGSATFNGVLYGTGVSSAGQGSVYSLTGTSKFEVNFAGFSNGTLTLVPVGKNLATGSSVNFGSFTINVSRSIGDSLVGYGSNSPSFSGRYYGPNAEEFGGAFQLTPDVVGNGTTLTGIALGKR